MTEDATAEDGDAQTAPRQAQDLAGAVVAGAAVVAALVLGLPVSAWLAAALPMLVLGGMIPRVPGDRWWRLPAVLGVALLPAGWAIGSDAPLVALTLLAALVGGASASAWLLGRSP